MKNTHFFLSLLALSFTLKLYSQTDIAIPLDKSISLGNTVESFDIDICYELLFPNRIFRDNTEYNIISPKTEKPLAYGLADFRNSNQGIKNSWAYLIEDYKSANPYFYFDNNNNLDFTDDGPPRQFFPDSLLSFYDGKLKAKFLSFKIEGQNRVLLKLNMEGSDLASRTIVGKNEKVIPSKYWYNEVIADVAKGEIAFLEKNYTIEVFDYDGNLKFGSKQDLLFTTTDDSPIKDYWEFEKGQFTLGETSFRIQSLSINADTLVIVEDSKVNLPKKFNLGDRVNDLEVETLAGKTKLKSLYQNYEYTLLDFWATWCAPCIEAMPKIEVLKEKFPEFGVIGFAADKRRLIERFEERNPHSWVNIIVEKELEFQFNIRGLPTYYIIDKEGKIVHYSKGPSGVEEFLNKNLK